MSKHTVVLSFEDGKEPTYHAGMQVLGGSVGAVQFSDALEEMQLIEEQRDELLEALSAIVERIDYYASLKDEGKPNIEDWAYTYSSTDMIKARAAIAKARGTPC